MVALASIDRLRGGVRQLLTPHGLPPSVPFGVIHAEGSHPQIAVGYTRMTTRATENSAPDQ